MLEDIIAHRVQYSVFLLHNLQNYRLYLFNYPVLPFSENHELSKKNVFSWHFDTCLWASSLLQCGDSSLGGGGLVWLGPSSLCVCIRAASEIRYSSTVLLWLWGYLCIPLQLSQGSWLRKSQSSLCIVLLVVMYRKNCVPTPRAAAEQLAWELLFTWLSSFTDCTSFSTFSPPNRHTRTHHQHLCISHQSCRVNFACLTPQKLVAGQAPLNTARKWNLW